MAVTVKITDKTPQAKRGSKDGLMKAILESCIKVYSQAKLLAPVDTSFLRSSLGYVTQKSSQLLAEGGFPVVVSVYEGYVGATAVYAIYIEYGTRKMAAQPFLRPAAMILKKGATKEDIENVLAKSMKQYTDTFK